MSRIIPGYDCIAETRKIRDELDALYAKDPAAYFARIESAPQRLWDSVKHLLGAAGEEE